MNIIDNEIIQLISILAISILAFSIGIQKLLKEWKSNSAENGIISLMHTELERMSLQNTKLSEELNKLQDQIIQLHSELSKLTIENNKLQEEVAALTIEINGFKNLAVVRK